MSHEWPVSRGQTTPMFMYDFAKTMTKTLKEFKDLQTCAVGNIDEDILLTSEKQCCSMFCTERFKQVVAKPTHVEHRTIMYMFLPH